MARLVVHTSHFRRLRQKDCCEFEARLGYIVNEALSQNNRNNNSNLLSGAQLSGRTCTKSV